MGLTKSFFNYIDPIELVFIVVNTVMNRVARLLGKDEAVRFIHLTLYQGAPAKKSLTTLVQS
jgi:peptidylprolyl isomerase domain and WD repeat-containing protein 1